jgi:phosphatidylserine/phosphatidylglycerophosphate/cardiolipin synthase-like enzyme
VHLIVQPDDGIEPVLDTIEKAKKTLDLIIFRFDLKRVEKALEAAVDRGVVVRALIAHTNSGGERRLRQLEQRMLDAGVTVSRTADDLVRYHGKVMIADRSTLHIYGFNCTALDVKSRSFGLVCRDRRSVQEGLRLFEADAAKQDYEPSLDTFVVSPENAREQLATFIKRAKKQLLIWDPKVTDPQMIRLLQQRAKAGVDVRVIGKVSKRADALKVEKFAGKRLHVRAMVRDGENAFVGSQSLRALELDRRREVGLITKDLKVVKRLAEIFEADWARTSTGTKQIKELKKDQKDAIVEAALTTAAGRGV